MYRVIVLTLAVLVTACSQEYQYDNYLGRWEKSGDGSVVVMQITKKDGSYQLDRNIFIKTNYLGNAKEVKTLTFGKRQLLLAAAGESKPLELSRNKQILNFDGNKYSRITDERVAELEVKYAAQRKAKGEAKKVCKELKEEYKDQKKVTKKKYENDDPNNRDEQLERLKYKYIEMLVEIPDCSL